MHLARPRYVGPALRRWRSHTVETVDDNSISGAIIIIVIHRNCRSSKVIVTITRTVTT